MKYSIPFVSFIFLLLPFTADSKTIRDKVSIIQGEKLVVLAIAKTPYEGAGFGSPYTRNETFLIYQILGKYEGTAAWLAVNPWTGDVWNMDACSLFTNPALLKAQEAIKQTFSAKEAKEYDRLHKLKPYREYDLEPCP